MSNVIRKHRRELLQEAALLEIMHPKFYEVWMICRADDNHFCCAVSDYFDNDWSIGREWYRYCDLRFLLGYHPLNNIIEGQE